ncbi:hypothetical protein [Methylotenera versatilis]|uniref:Uncharacterized protein n=1 Tax=Methylotenera versatilis (strain 301) TaxID=666681 RepID=D7DKP3_METV0|nr:hypothetical protein [Methylotenera versatilis]ADI30489.1 hypothetical protein M301_2121 [Methylotenera versatilis 301]
MARTLQTIWCDDVRVEAGNKISLMGVYGGEMLVPAFPFTIEKLCLSCKSSTDIKKPFKQLKLVVSKDKTIMAEVEMSEMESQQVAPVEHIKNGANIMSVQSLIILRQIVIDSPAIFRVKLISETGEVKGHGLRVGLAQQPSI